MDETSQDVNNLYNLTTSLATSLSYHQIVLYIRSVLANLRDSLSYIIKVSTHTIDYIDAATMGTLSPHILPVIDLKMLSHIEETLPSTIHLPVSSEDNLHFYCYLCTHVLIANKQFLLLINVPIQDRSQLLSIYTIFTLDIPHGNFTAHYDVNTKYLRITQDKTMAVDVSLQQFWICQEANRQFCTIPTVSTACKPTILHYCSICQKHSQMFFTNQEIFRCQYALTTCPRCLDINNSTLSSQTYTHMPGRGNSLLK